MLRSPSCGEQPRGDQERVAGQEEAHHQAGLCEDDEDQPVEADEPDQFRDVVDGSEELLDQLHAARSCRAGRERRKQWIIAEAARTAAGPAGTGTV